MKLLEEDRNRPLIVSESKIKLEVEPPRELLSVVDDRRLLPIGHGEDGRAVRRMLEANELVETTLTGLLCPWKITR